MRKVVSVIEVKQEIVNYNIAVLKGPNVRNVRLSSNREDILSPNFSICVEFRVDPEGKINPMKVGGSFRLNGKCFRQFYMPIKFEKRVTLTLMYVDWKLSEVKVPKCEKKIGPEAYNVLKKSANVLKGSALT